MQSASIYDFKHKTTPNFLNGRDNMHFVYANIWFLSDFNT